MAPSTTEEPARTREFLDWAFALHVDLDRRSSSALRSRSARGRILATVLHVYDGMSVGNSSAISSRCAPDSSRHDLVPASTPARTWLGLGLGLGFRLGLG